MKAVVSGQCLVGSKEPEDKYPGHHWEWVPDEGWRIGGDGRTCRMPRCQKLAVVKMKRRWRGKGMGHQWWAYCADHMYGRKIENGVVVHRILVKDEASA